MCSTGTTRCVTTELAMALSISVSSVVKEKPTSIISAASFDRRISLWMLRIGSSGGGRSRVIT
jgi:hypothetical protein